MMSGAAELELVVTTRYLALPRCFSRYDTRVELTEPPPGPPPPKLDRPPKARLFWRVAVLTRFGGPNVPLALIRPVAPTPVGDAGGVPPRPLVALLGGGPKPPPGPFA